MMFTQASNRPPLHSAYHSGVRDTIFVIPSYLLFGLLCGVASVNAGLTTGASLALPAHVFAGSSQTVLLQFLQGNALLWVAILSGCVINLRMAVYSAVVIALAAAVVTRGNMLVTLGVGMACLHGLPWLVGLAS